MYKVHKRVETLKTDDGYNWQERCFRLPVLKIPTIGGNRRKREINSDLFSDFSNDDWDWGLMDNSLEEIKKEEAGVGEGVDPSVLFYPDPYCEIVAQMPTACFEESLLEIFAVDGAYNESIFETLTQEDVIRRVNKIDKRYVFLAYP